MQNTPTVLIVDDTPANIEIVQGVLESEGFRTLTACDGPSAVALARSEQPDLILLDVVMPGESGFETCARLKSSPATSDIPIIFLSALDDVKNKVTGLKVGGVDYVSKPVHGEEVLARVRVHLRIRDVNRRLVEEQRARLGQLRHAQQAILVDPADCPDAAFGVYYRPLEDVSGDFYDVVRIAPGVFGYFVAAISGHGVSASFLMSAVKALLQHYANPMFAPEDALRGIDSVMRQMLGAEQYLTACYACLNRQSKRLSVISAGHPPLLLVSRSGEATVVEGESEPLGVFSSAMIQRKELRVSCGDRFYIFSDGLLEPSPQIDRRQRLANLVAACLRYRDEPIRGAPRRIAGDVRPAPAAIGDDLLLVGVDTCPGPS